MLISDVLEFFNTSETMSDRQVAMTVDLIIEEYPYLKTDDLKLCFRNAMKMKYGKLYNRIDGQIIMGWLREYNQERCFVADQQGYNDHKAHLAENTRETDGIFYPEYRAGLEEKSKAGDEQAMRMLAISDSLLAELERRKYAKQRKNLDRFYENEERRKSEERAKTS